jgi:hypothetical protein
MRRQARSLAQLLVSAVLACAAAALLSSCAKAPAVGEAHSGLADLQIGHLQCTTVELRDDVLVTREIIHEESITRGGFLLALRYQEAAVTPTRSAAEPREYADVSLVLELEERDDQRVVERQRYCVVEKWRVSAQKNEKVCWQWMIDMNGASMKIMLEDRLGRLLREWLVPLPPEEIGVLIVYLQKLAGEMVEKTAASGGRIVPALRPGAPL